VVIVANYQGADRYVAQFHQEADAGVLDDAQMSELCLLHVAATRAKRHLFVLHHPH
jgi:ATP-dependent exoDNAse (exonuclease V) beta subunit